MPSTTSSSKRSESKSVDGSGLKVPAPRSGGARSANAAVAAANAPQRQACVFCDSTLASVSGLKRHLQTVHSVGKHAAPVTPSITSHPPTDDVAAIPSAVLAATPPSSPPDAGIGGLPSPAPRSRKRRWLIAAGIALVVLVAGGVGVAHSAPASNKVTLSGELVLEEGSDSDLGSNFTSDGATCSGTDGYEDLTDGASVTIHDPSDTVIATGNLEAGTPTDTGCVFDWTISGVPKEKFYGVEISHRGTVTFSAGDVAGGLDTSIGS